MSGYVRPAVLESFSVVELVADAAACVIYAY
jgi:hypothetical protein